MLSSASFVKIEIAMLAIILGIIAYSTISLYLGILVAYSFAFLVKKLR